jgi:hypothetical protein
VKEMNKNINIDGIKNLIMKVFFREKYLKNQDILELAAEFEELLGEAEINY